MPGALPAVDQDFGINAAAYLAGMATMIAETNRLADAIDGVMARAAAMPAAVAAGSALGGTGGPDLSRMAANLDSIQVYAHQSAAALEDMSLALQDTNRALTAVNPAARATAAGFGFLGAMAALNQRHVQLFAGALTAVGIPAFIASASALHILVDGLLETVAVVVPASIALGAFGLAAIPTLVSIGQQMKALYITSTALGTSIYPLTGSFQRLASAVQPQVYELFGQLLVLMNSKTGEFATVAKQAGSVVDQLGARFVAAVTAGSGLGVFMQHAAADLAGLGDVVFNVFGAIGNVLKVMPGYAEILLGVLDGLSRALEAITASPFTQWLVQSFLYFHGFALWVGLAATGVTLLGNALIGLAAKFGLATAGALAFDAAQFGAGLSILGHAIADLTVALFTFSGAEDVAAASSVALEGVMTTLGAINPLVWIGAAVGGLAYLVYELARGTTYVDEYTAAVQKAFASVPVSQLGIDLTLRQTQALQDLSVASKAYGELNMAQTKAALTALGQVLEGTGKLTAAQYAQAEKALEAGSALGKQQALLPVLSADLKNYNTLLRAAGGNNAMLAAAGLSSNQVLNASKSQMQQYVIEVQAAADAQRALALGIGRSAAARNAQTNDFLTNALPAMQKVVQAEDAVITVILGSRQAFTSFAQDLSTVSTAAQASGAHLSGLNAASLTLASDFYGTLVPAAQKVIDALQQQMVSTRNLGTAVADEARQMLPFTQHNAEARSVIVDLINNALGPGTVSMKTLDGWVKANSGSMQGFNAIVAQATVNAGNLAKTLAGLLNEQFRQDLLAASGANVALRQYATDLAHAGTAAAQTAGDRARLIADLRNAGFTAQQATAYVNGLSQSLAKVPAHVPIRFEVQGAQAAIAAAQAIARAIASATGTFFANIDVSGGSGRGTGAGGTGPPPHKTGGAMAGMAVAGGTVIVHNHYYNIAGSVITEHQLGRAVARASGRQDARNSASQFRLPSRIR